MEICQQVLPFTPWAERGSARLPGVQPADPGDWLRVDEAYGAQMAYRERLIAERPDAVMAAMPGAEAAMQETLEAVLAALPPLGYGVAPDHVIRPDGVRIGIDRADPLRTLGLILQEDVNIHLKPPGASEHHLMASVLCFPASWTLAEKIGRPLTQVHEPVAPYDAHLAARVQRMFDAMRPGQVLWRANALLYADPDLFQPRPKGHGRRAPGAADPVWLRSERQCLRKLADTGAVVFTIHTYVLPLEALTPDQRATLEASAIAQDVLGV